MLRKIITDFENLIFLIQYEQYDPKSRINALLQTLGEDEKLAGQLHRLYRKTEPREFTTSHSPEQLLLTGSIPSKIFLHPSTTVGEAGDAVKQDILRSLAARLEMHWETLVDEVNGSPEGKKKF